MIRDFSTLSLKISYDSGTDDLLNDFYIPMLSLANSYDRIAGFFSSGSLALAARGIACFISHGGKMRLVTCPQFSKSDIEMMEKAVLDMDSILSETFIKEYDDIESSFQRDHVRALGWMLATGTLEIKIAILKKNGRILSKEEIEQSGILHQKVGIFRDQAGNVISFSGSLNESALGWLGNTEEFKVFMSYAGSMPFVNSDIQKFDSFWNGNRKDVEIIPLPKAIKEHLLHKSQDFNVESITIDKYKKTRYSISLIPKKKPLKLFFYQKMAVEKWKKNNYQLLLEMATGTGKTCTAIGCICEVLNTFKKPLIIVSTPQPTLSSQWKNVIDSLDVNVANSFEINGNVLGWDKTLRTELIKLSVGKTKHLILYTTHDICHSEKFIYIIKECNKNIVKFFIGDEVHGLGAKKMRNALLDEYELRLGLSATPKRWFDDEGSEIIANYFGNDSFEFSIRDALQESNPVTGKPFLVNYSYYPRFIELEDEEIEEYAEVTRKISKMSNSTNEEIYACLEFLRFQRANIGKNARMKYSELELILNEIGSEISDTIIFVSHSQIDNVLQILSKRGIIAAPYTMKQSTKPSKKYEGLSERQFIIKQFKEKKYQVIVAIKCLDEGIDIPEAKRAIIMASSTNPREYVQRIGRVIRQAPGKTNAEIYDMIIKPDLSGFSEDKQIELETRIFKKEMDRVLELSENAINNVTVCNQLYRILEEVSK